MKVVFVFKFNNFHSFPSTGKMEEIREDKIGSVLSWLQSGARGKASRMAFKKLQDQKLALYSCQRAIKTMMVAKGYYLPFQLFLLID